MLSDETALPGEAGRLGDTTGVCARSLPFDFCFFDFLLLFLRLTLFGPSSGVSASPVLILLSSWSAGERARVIHGYGAVCNGVFEFRPVATHFHRKTSDAGKSCLSCLSLQKSINVAMSLVDMADGSRIVTPKGRYSGSMKRPHSRPIRVYGGILDLTPKARPK